MKSNTSIRVRMSYKNIGFIETIAKLKNTSKSKALECILDQIRFKLQTGQTDLIEIKEFTMEEPQ